jgi:O-antigen ligase
VLPLANSNPVTGIGLRVTQFQTDQAKQPHNDFIRAYVETGIIGFVGYVSVMVALVALGRRAVRAAPAASLDRGVAAGFFGCALAFLAVSLVANVISNVVNLWYLVAFAAAASAVVRRHAQRPVPVAAGGASAPAVTEDRSDGRDPGDGRTDYRSEG